MVLVEVLEDVEYTGQRGIQALGRKGAQIGMVVRSELKAALRAGKVRELNAKDVQTDSHGYASTNGEVVDNGDTSTKEKDTPNTKENTEAIGVGDVVRVTIDGAPANGEVTGIRSNGKLKVEVSGDSKEYRLIDPKNVEKL